MHPPREMAGQRTLRILIVDDDAVLSGLLAETLDSRGHVICGIEATEDGAVQAAARERPDLIIVDVSLALGSGIRAIEQIQRLGPVPHVFMSGERLRLASEVLLKPFRIGELLLAIDHALSAAPAPHAIP